MFPELKAKINWEPVATLQQLQRRARLLAQIRKFFSYHNILEVETPLLCQQTVTDLHLESFRVPVSDRYYYLQTSPEYAMKRLLAAGCGSIYQICKAFRMNEAGRWHNPEFTLLEWYRTSFDHHQLMDDVEALLLSLGPFKSAKRLTYQQVFWNELRLDISTCSFEDIFQCVALTNLGGQEISKLQLDDCLQFLFSEIIQPKLGMEAPVFVYNYPKSQAALARLSEENREVAERFELYIQGVEIANGFHELADSSEQLSRFITNQKQRLEVGLLSPQIDYRLISALEHGLPDCSGVALGIDRLLMVISQLGHIDEVISFPWDRA